MKKFKLIFLTGAILALPGATTVKAQVLPTKLRVTVLDDLGNLQEGAVVAVFSNETDYRFETNPVAGPEETDKKGTVTFKKIPAQSYYILVIKGDKKNDGRGVKTSKLDTGKMNKINIVIQ